jgi:hypothetical protein
MSTGDTLLFWAFCMVIVHGALLGLVNVYKACQIWRKIRQRRRHPCLGP